MKEYLVSYDIRNDAWDKAEVIKYITKLANTEVYTNIKDGYKLTESTLLIDTPASIEVLSKHLEEMLNMSFDIAEYITFKQIR